jgi:hypothetical protein
MLFRRSGRVDTFASGLSRVGSGLGGARAILEITLCTEVGCRILVRQI